MKKVRTLLLIPLLILLTCGSWSPPDRNVILFIGDGMGHEQVKAAEYYTGDTFFMKSAATYSGEISTLNYYGEITDSAASATAMAAGRKVANSVISRSIPGDHSDLESIFEYGRAVGYRTGIVTTSYICDATPAAFTAHAVSRNEYAAIAQGIMGFTPDFVMGGRIYLEDEMILGRGYYLFSGVDALDLSVMGHTNIFAVIANEGRVPYEYDDYLDYGTVSNYLSKMTQAALDYIDSRRGTLAVIEGGRIDHAGHAADIERAVFETVEFFNAVWLAYQWAQGSENYLIIVTADHETGGLVVLNDNGPGNFPDVQWTAENTDGYYSHTAAEVPLYIYSDMDLPGQDMSDNTDIYYLVKKFILQ